MATFQAKQDGKGREREKIKIIILFRSYPTRNKKFHQIAKNFKKLEEYRFGFISSHNRLEQAKKQGK